MAEEEYEIIPTSPLRRLEKRISRVETASSSSQIQKLIEQIIELIKSNQRIIDDVIKADSELRNEISKLPGRIDVLVSSMSEFIELLKASAAEEAATGISKDAMEPLVEKMDELVNQNKKSLDTNQAVLNSLGMIDNRLKRLYLQSSTSAASYKR
jgi:tetrahydromethanopterin S-methyltransferase subunit B